MQMLYLSPEYFGACGGTEAGSNCAGRAGRTLLFAGKDTGRIHRLCKIPSDSVRVGYQRESRQDAWRCRSANAARPRRRSYRTSCHFLQRATVCVRTDVENQALLSPTKRHILDLLRLERRMQPWKPWITNDKAYSSWNVDAVVEYGAGADHDRDGCRVAGSVRALFALQGNRNRPVQ